LLDEHIRVAVADGLLRVGIDVVTAHEAIRKGTADADHSARSLLEHRVVVTHDVDYLQLHGSGTRHA
jgi:predicted nuclease of predicted toxin-antitoxin system